MANDLKSMTKKQLEKLQKDVQKALQVLQNKEMKDARKAAEKAAAKFGFSLSELTGQGATPAKRAKAPKKAGVAKYANPDDQSQTWTGKGRQPAWFKSAVEAGKKPQDLEI